MKFLLLSLLALTTSNLYATSISTSYECKNANPSIMDVYLDEVITSNGIDNSIVYDYKLVINSYNQDTDTEEKTILSTGVTKKSFEAGKKGFAIFGDQSRAAQGVIPDSTIVAKDENDFLSVVLDGNTHVFTCTALSQADL